MLLIVVTPTPGHLSIRARYPSPDNSNEQPKPNTVRHCKSEPPEDWPTDAVAAAFVTLGTATASIYRCHGRLYGREDRKTKREGAERGTGSWRANTEEGNAEWTETRVK